MAHRAFDAERVFPPPTLQDSDDHKPSFVDMLAQWTSYLAEGSMQLLVDTGEYKHH